MTSSDSYSDDCPEPARHEGDDNLAPSGLPASAQTDAHSAGYAMEGFDHAASGGFYHDATAADYERHSDLREHCERGVNAATEIVNRVLATVRAFLSTHIDECHAIVDRCHGSCCGCIDLHLDECARTCDKVHSKIEQYLVTRLAHAYNILARFGVTIPTDEEVQAAALSGGRELSPIPQPAEPLFPSPPVSQPAAATEAPPAVFQQQEQQFNAILPPWIQRDFKLPPCYYIDFCQTQDLYWYIWWWWWYWWRFGKKAFGRSYNRLPEHLRKMVDDREAERPIGSSPDVPLGPDPKEVGQFVGQIAFHAMAQYGQLQGQAQAQAQQVKIGPTELSAALQGGPLSAILQAVMSCCPTEPPRPYTESPISVPPWEPE